MITAKNKGYGAALLGLGMAFAGSANAAQCTHVVSNEWNTGFTGSIRITNDGASAINGWDVHWQYANNSITSSWNANVSGGNPYSATNLGWNGTIQPGQSVEFGFQANKNGGSAESPVITGDVCNGGASSSTPASSSSSVASSSSSSVASSVPSSSSSSVIPTTAQCNWYGTLYPLCDTTQSGWGWENNQSCIARTTCVSQPPPYGVVDGNASSSVSSSVVSSSSSSVVVSSSSSSVPSSSSSAPSSSVGSSSSSSTPNTSGTFRVDGSGNITKNGEVLPMHCGAWFGLEGQFEPKDAENNAGGAPMELYMGNMWWADTGRTIQQTMDEIKALGVNVIRLPIAPQTLDPNDPQGIGDIRSGGVLKNAPSVRQTNARQALEDFIKAADANNLQVIVDIHSCSNYVGWRAGRLDATPPYTDANREDYDFTREDYSCGPAPAGVTVQEYNKSIWLSNLREIAGMSEDLGVDNIVAIDIFNEPWDYTWAEWKSLSESAYQAINEVNSDVLIMVEGIGSETSDGTKVPHGDEASNPNWGENLYGFADAPLDIPKERLILSPHTYGPSVFVQKQVIDQTDPACVGLEGDAAGDAGCEIVIDQARLEAGWEEHFGYLRDQGYAIVVGEFGGNMDWPASGGTNTATQNRWSFINSPVDQQWQQAFVNYAKKENIQACYWSINPESGDTGGLYTTPYDPESNASAWGTWGDFDSRKVNLLKDLWGI